MPLGACSLCPERESMSIGVLAEIDRDLADSLDRIGMEKDAAFAGHLRPPFQRGIYTPVSLFAHMRVTIAVIGCERFLVLFEIEPAFSIHGYFGHLVAQGGKMMAKHPDRRMLDPARNNVLLAGVAAQSRADCRIVAFRAATGEYDLIG